MSKYLTCTLFACWIPANHWPATYATFRDRYALFRCPNWIRSIFIQKRSDSFWELPSLLGSQTYLNVVRAAYPTWSCLYSQVLDNYVSMSRLWTPMSGAVLQCVDQAWPQRRSVWFRGPEASQPIFQVYCATSKPRYCPVNKLLVALWSHSFRS